MTIKLPRLQAGLPIVNAAGQALSAFSRFWDQFATQIEASLSPTGSGIVVAGNDPQGDVVSLEAGTGLTLENPDGTGGNPMFALADTAVTPGSYGAADHVAEITVDAQGRLTAASAVAIAITPAAAGLGNVSNKKQLPLDGSDAMTGVIELFGDMTGAGTAVGFGTNCPATTLTGPYTWLAFKSHDGSTVYVPAYK